MNEFAYALWCGRLSHALDYLANAIQYGDQAVIEVAQETARRTHEEFQRAFDAHKGTLAAPRLVPSQGPGLKRSEQEKARTRLVPDPWRETLR